MKLGKSVKRELSGDIINNISNPSFDSCHFKPSEDDWNLLKTIIFGPINNLVDIAF